MTNLTELLRPVLTLAIASSPPDRPPAEVAAEAVEAVEGDPRLSHAANAEPWYRSRVTLGALLSALAPVLGAFGVALTPEHQEAIVALIVALGGVAGPALTLWGRWVAKTPIGAR